MSEFNEAFLNDVKKKNDLTDEQLQEFIEAFHLFDKDKNGFIDSSELGHLMRILGQNYSEEEIKKMIEGVDTIKKDEKIDFEEFVLFMRINSKDKVTQEEELRAAFKVFDADGNGKIDQTELSDILKKFGEKLTEAETEEMIKSADLDGDGKISYEEFITMFLQDLKGH